MGIRQRGVVCRHNQCSSDHDPEGGDGVAEHVEIGAADIQVVLRPVVQPESDREVHDDRGAGDADHRRAAGGLRLTDPGNRLPPDHEPDRHQGEGVGKRHEDADAVVAEGHALVGRLVGNPEGVPTESQRRGIGQVVPRVGEQRETVREPSTHGFDGRQRSR